MNYNEKFGSWDMELTDAMIDEIRQAARLAEYRKVTVEIEMKGNEPSLDIVTTSRRRFQKAMPGNRETTGSGRR
jgi:hypothetical protein